MATKRAPSKSEIAAAAAMLLLARKTSKAMLAAAALASRSMIASGAAAVQIAHGIQSSQAAVVQAARLRARSQSRDHWASTTGIDAQPTDTAQDSLRAWTAASALAFAWSESQRALVDRQDLSRSVAARQATRALRQNIERTATTETVHAWNDEIARLDDVAASRGYVVVETWSALVDACPECNRLDGQTVTRPNRFPQDPPLHPRCRCLLITDAVAALPWVA